MDGFSVRDKVKHQNKVLNLLCSLSTATLENLPWFPVMYSVLIGLFATVISSRVSKCPHRQTHSSHCWWKNCHWWHKEKLQWGSLLAHDRENMMKSYSRLPMLFTNISPKQVWWCNGKVHVDFCSCISLTQYVWRCRTWLPVNLIWSGKFPIQEISCQSNWQANQVEFIFPTI